LGTRRKVENQTLPVTEMTTSKHTYQATRERFDRPETARAYLNKKSDPGNARNRREMACILKALDGLPVASTVLDLPCGAGRLLPMLLDKQFTVVAADFSREMLKVAEADCLERFEESAESTTRLSFQQQDILRTTFEENTFDAVICNRLLHHYPQAELRQQVLTELLRITKPDGRLIVSFFSNFALSALLFHLKNKLQGITPTDRIPIWHGVFRRDYERAGWQSTGYYPVWYGKSPQTYLRLEPCHV